MNWLDRFLGTKDKEQKERTEQVSNYVHNKKNMYTSQMGKIHTQAKKTREKTRQAHVESAKLLRVVEDITVQIARSMGGDVRSTGGTL